MALADSLTEKFSPPGTALDISLLNRMLEFKFGTEQFEQDLSEWETLKTRYETQAETALPDSILVTTLLSRTAGTLRQHLKMNLRLLDTYDIARNVVTEYHQSRHVTGFESLSDTGHAPMEIGSMRQGKGMKGATLIGMATGPGVLEVIPLHLSFVPASATNCIQQRCRDLRQFHWCAV